MAERQSRKAVFSDSFYPGDPEELVRVVSGYIDSAPSYTGSRIRAIVVPHAGYVFSGEVTGCGYKALADSMENSRYSGTFFLVGVAHRSVVDGICIAVDDVWESPLGEVKISKRARKMVEKEALCNVSDDAHSSEHSLEVQLPFLQFVMNDSPIEIIPALVSDLDYRKIADVLESYLEEGDIIIASTDLSHYQPYDVAVRTDRRTIDAFVNLDIEKMLDHGDACGKVPLLGLMELANREKWVVEERCYQNSGDSTGDKDAVVGYASLVVHE